MDEDRIRLKIGVIENYVTDLKAIVPETFDDYKNNKTTRYAIERLFQVIIEGILDVCAILVNELKIGPPRDEDGLLNLLKASKFKDLKEKVSDGRGGLETADVDVARIEIAVQSED